MSGLLPPGSAEQEDTFLILDTKSGTRVKPNRWEWDASKMLHLDRVVRMVPTQIHMPNIWPNFYKRRLRFRQDYRTAVAETTVAPADLVLDIPQSSFSLTGVIDWLNSQIRTNLLTFTGVTLPTPTTLTFNGLTRDLALFSYDQLNNRIVFGTDGTGTAPDIHRLYIYEETPIDYVPKNGRYVENNIPVSREWRFLEETLGFFSIESFGTDTSDPDLEITPTITSRTASNPPNIGGISAVHMLSRYLAPSNALITENNNRVTVKDIMTVVPLADTIYGNTLIFRPNTLMENHVDYNSIQAWNNIDITLESPEGIPLELPENIHFQVVLNVWHHQDK